MHLLVQSGKIAANGRDVQGPRSFRRHRFTREQPPDVVLAGVVRARPSLERNCDVRILCTKACSPSEVFSWTLGVTDAAGPTSATAGREPCSRAERETGRPAHRFGHGGRRLRLRFRNQVRTRNLVVQAGGDGSNQVGRDFVHTSCLLFSAALRALLGGLFPVFVIVVVTDLDVFQNAQGVVGQHGEEKYSVSR